MMPKKQRFLDKPDRKPSNIGFYRQLLEQLLTTGNAIVWKDDNAALHVAITSGSSFTYKTWGNELSVWSLQTNIYHTNQLEIPHDPSKVCLIHLGNMQGDVPHLVPSPLEIVKLGLMLHEKARALLLSYASYGHAVGAVVKPSQEMQDRENAANMMEELSKELKSISENNYSLFTTPPEAEVEVTSNVAMPDTSLMDLALKEIARVYGVPLELLQCQSERTEYSNIDDHLLSDAVYPVLDSISDGLSRLLNTKVTYKEIDVMRASFGSTAKSVTNLSQTGTITINEMREYMGLPEVPWGNQPPQAVGGPDRSGQGKDGGDKKPNGGQKKTTSSPAPK